MRGCLLKGASVADLAQQMIVLTVLGVGILGLSIVLFRRRVA
jgi:LPXTG-motif cell wall-anchored protein